MKRAKAPADEVDKVRYDMSAEFDFPEVPCRLKYLVCSIPRTGSWLLCTGLASTGQAGRPAEYISRPYMNAFKQRFGLPDDTSKEEFWQYLLKHRTSPNGAFGVKMHFEHIQANFPKPAEKRKFLARFDRFIFLWRRDKLAQAVSAFKASRTKVFRLGAEESVQQAQPLSELYDYAGIADRLSTIATQEASWRAILGFFAERTFSVTYEELSSDYAGTLRRVLAALGLDEAASALNTRPQLRPQRDDMNTAWEERFVRDLAGAKADPPASTQSEPSAR